MFLAMVVPALLYGGLAFTLIAYDDSEDAKSAITSAGELLTPAPALVVTAWPAAERSVGTSGGVIATYSPIFGEIDELERTNARATAEEGAALARQAGFDANPLIVRSSDRNVWHAILDLGAEHDARAIVLGLARARRADRRAAGQRPRQSRPSRRSARTGRSREALELNTRRLASLAGAA